MNPGLQPLLERFQRLSDKLKPEGGISRARHNGGETLSEWAEPVQHVGFVSHELAVMAGVLLTGETEELERLRQVEAADLFGCSRAISLKTKVWLT